MRVLCFCPIVVKVQASFVKRGEALRADVVISQTFFRDRAVDI